MFLLVLLLLSLAGVSSAQTTFCTTSAVPPLLRAEGLAERVGDIQLLCTGAPNVTLTGNFTFVLSVTVTNRLSSTNTLTGIVFTVDSGAGPQPVLVEPIMVNQNSLVFNGAGVKFSPQGTARINVAGIRVNANQVAVQTPITAYVAINAAGFPITTSPLVVGVPQRGLLAGSTGTLVCAQYGSPLPDVLTFSNLLKAHTAFTSTRLTEGFGDAFGPRTDPNYFNADSGQRIIVRYSGFPADAHLFVPAVIAGSDTIQPTAAGDFEVAAAGGTYVPSAKGSLLLAIVAGASSNGSGGGPAFLPPLLGSGPVSFDFVAELPIVNGTAFAVYEVVDANPSVVETAQFPTFLGLPPDGNRQASTTSQSVSFAPVSTVATASSTEPLPRFLPLTPPPDCDFLGDCGFVQGTLVVDTTPFQFTEPSNGATAQSYFNLRNTGGGRMSWVTSILYRNGPGQNASAWLTLDPPQGVNDTSVRVFANPRNLPAGTYQAFITVNASPNQSAMVPVTFVVTAALPQPVPAHVPTVAGVVNAANFAVVPVVPGSLSTIVGFSFDGKNVSATFNNRPATILFSNDLQINLMVPDLGGATSANLIVSVDGVDSAATTVPVAPFEPAIFPNALLNQDGTRNSIDNAAPIGTIVYFFATGLSGNGTITVRIGDRVFNSLYYAGPAPGLPGVQQVNLKTPLDLAAGAANLYVCGSSAGSETVCSQPVSLILR
jgi:uncharacterized protein (TIGR03437 family)